MGTREGLGPGMVGGWVSPGPGMGGWVGGLVSPGPGVILTSQQPNTSISTICSPIVQSWLQHIDDSSWTVIRYLILKSLSDRQVKYKYSGTNWNFPNDLFIRRISINMNRLSSRSSLTRLEKRLQSVYGQPFIFKSLLMSGWHSGDAARAQTIYRRSSFNRLLREGRPTTPGHNYRETLLSSVRTLLKIPIPSLFSSRSPGEEEIYVKLCSVHSTGR